MKKLGREVQPTAETCAGILCLRIKTISILKCAFPWAVAEKLSGFKRGRDVGDHLQAASTTGKPRPE